MLMFVPAVLTRFEEQGTASQLLKVMVSTGARATEHDLYVQQKVTEINGIRLYFRMIGAR